MPSAVIALMLALLTFSHSAQALRRGAPRTVPVDMVVVHSTGGPTCDAKTGRAIWVKAGTMDDNLRHIEAHPRLGIHYMIDRDGTTRTSVPEHEVAHHVFRYSARSIAVELINDGDGVDAFAAPQIDTLVRLLRDIVQRRPLIGREGIKRHSDLDTAMMPCNRSLRRKVDPGDALPWDAVIARVF